MIRYAAAILVVISTIPMIVNGCGKAAADEPPKCGAISFGTVGNGSLCLMPNSDRCYIYGAAISCVR
jgi:hypothetical protein